MHTYSLRVSRRFWHSAIVCLSVIGIAFSNGLIDSQRCLGAAEKRLIPPQDKDSESAITWEAAGYRVEFLTPRVALADAASEFSVSCRTCEVTDNVARLQYELGGDGTLPSLHGTLTIDVRIDPHSPTLRIKENLELGKPSRLDIRVTGRYRVANRAVALVTEDTQFRPLKFYSGTEAIYTRGAIAHPLTRDHKATAVFRLVDGSTDVDGHALSMPVVALAFGGRAVGPSFLSIACDPFHGMQATASLEKGHTLLERESIYRGTVVPFRRQQRVIVLEWTDRGAEGIFHVFYRTVPEIEPCAAWARNVAMGYYDYNSDDGRGWYNDLTTLAGRIPPDHRGKVACCLHGWYDRLGFYCYDQKSDTLADTWTAFDNGDPARKPIRMSKREVHRRIAFAKKLGFRVVLYYADCTNMTAGKVEESWCGKNYKRYLYTNKAGKQPAGCPLPVLLVRMRTIRNLRVVMMTRAARSRLTWRAAHATIRHGRLPIFVVTGATAAYAVWSCVSKEVTRLSNATTANGRRCLPNGQVRSGPDEFLIHSQPILMAPVAFQTPE